MTLLGNGRYDVVIIGARDISEDGVQLEIAVTSGEHRGVVVEMTAYHLNHSSIDVLGAPATLFVSDDAPRLEWD